MASMGKRHLRLQCSDGVVLKKGGAFSGPLPPHALWISPWTKSSPPFLCGWEEDEAGEAMLCSASRDRGRDGVATR